ncbi:flagellar basal body-associated FliL family protein [Aneurinibacillus terranovensis]|uniref:flagellar basal body-associated FliL family protein n=1 Tax=Aneurinibacillus terranovensis TaxID=278991 RepID=UPI0004829BE2|nr:flagellar basal body-associated FliL family protein [Aneurinibacillus terranovensis]
MFKNKLLTIGLIIVISIALLGVVAIFLWQSYLKPASSNAAIPSQQQQISADEFQKVTFQTDEITTNLLSGEVILAQFGIQADSEKTKAELQKRTIQVTHIIVETLSSLTPDNIKGAKGMEKMETDIKNKLNEVLQDGKVDKVITTHKVIQQ